VSVLKLREGKLDYLYLKKRARQVNVLELLETLAQKSGNEID